MLGYCSAEKQNPALVSAFFAPLRLTPHTENLAKNACFLQIAQQREETSMAAVARLQIRRNSTLPPDREPSSARSMSDFMGGLEYI